MRLTLSDLHKLIEREPSLVNLGCVIDTNALFAVATPPDRLNSWAIDVFSTLSKLRVPPYTNLNIRSEFLDLQRRVMIPEGLITFYDEREKDTMSLHLKTQLRSLKTQMEKAAKEERVFKLNDQAIKKYRAIFDATSANAWELFCRDFLKPHLGDIWDATITELNLQFLGTRAIESREYFERDPSWKDMTDIMGSFAVGSADAMIINFFLCSKFPLIVTGDEDVAYAVERMSSGNRFILTPSPKDMEANDING